jgi:hypothetical protein
MELLEHIAVVGSLIFIGILSWVGIFFMAAYFLQWTKDTIQERKRVEEAAKQDAWSVD